MKPRTEHVDRLGRPTGGLNLLAVAGPRKMRLLLGMLYIGAWELEALLEETFCCNCTGRQIMLGKSVWTASPCLRVISTAGFMSSESTIEL
jgi:hypothetical protein